jgi:aerobic carbon-monoxide dehydrogenase medium subunit
VHDFQFHSPRSLDEALALLEEHVDDGRAIAGGTALVVLMKQGLLNADHIIDLQHLPGLSGIRLEDDGLHIGALTHHREVETSLLVHDTCPLLAEVYGRVATVRIRNVATVGGGLAHGDPSQDPPPGLIALDASVRLTSRHGERILPVSDLFRDYYETAIEPGELLTELIVPPSPPDGRSVYLKFLPRTEDDYATVSVAATAVVAGGVCTRLRVGLGAAGPTPIHATAVERELEGQAVTPASIRRAAETAASLVDPLDDFRGSASYKRDMAVVFTRRALEAVLA